MAKAAKPKAKKPTGKTVTLKPKKKGQKPISFKNNGSLTKLAGKDSKTGKLKIAKVRQIAKGNGDAAKKAQFYLNVLAKKGK